MINGQPLGLTKDMATTADPTTADPMTDPTADPNADPMPEKTAVQMTAALALKDPDVLKDHLNKDQTVPANVNRTNVQGTNLFLRFRRVPGMTQVITVNPNPVPLKETVDAEALLAQVELRLLKHMDILVILTHGS